jgi:N-methylhydantoinase B/oxoprolinase/acetone carboxylase alpha subunit
MSNRISQFDNRIVYENAVKICTDAGVDYKGASPISQSCLRLEQTLVTTNTKYTFAVLVNNNGPAGTLFPTEVRLNQQDSFITSALTVRLGLPANAADCAFISHSYPNPVVFSTGAAALGVIYNSQMKVTINNVVKIPTLHLGRFRQVQFAQQAVAAANQNGIAQDSIDESSDGMMIVEPNIILIGSKNNLIEVTLPAALTAVDAGTRLIMEWRGVLVQNSTIIT